MRYFLIASVVILALVGIATVVWSDATDRYVPETGHVIEAHFVPFYDKHGGRSILGLPITDAFIDPKSELLIQYFENARLELVPDDDSGWNVFFTPLGQMLYGWDRPTDDDTVHSEPGCRFFPEARFSVCHAFLEYFEQHGGIEVFGLPISSNRVENGNLVQLFQRFRLEWIVNNSGNSEIRITPLGRIHFELDGYNPELLQPTLAGVVVTNPQNVLHIETSLSTPLLEVGTRQVVYVTVRDQNSIPLEGASTLLTAHFATGLQYILLPVTDENGVTYTSLTIEESPINVEVILEFLVQYESVFATARDSFLIR